MFVGFHHVLAMTGTPLRAAGVVTCSMIIYGPYRFSHLLYTVIASYSSTIMALNSLDLFFREFADTTNPAHSLFCLFLSILVDDEDS